MYVMTTDGYGLMLTQVTQILPVLFLDRFWAMPRQSIFHVPPGTPVGLLVLNFVFCLVVVFGSLLMGRCGLAYLQAASIDLE